MIRVSITWTNNNPDTIWNRLAAKLGREPTNAEAEAEVKRILSAVTVDMAAQGRLPHQRGKS